MLGEVAKRKNDWEAAVRYYCQGIEGEPVGMNENYTEIEEIC